MVESDLLTKIREQYDATPYPHTPLEDSPRENYAALFTHNLTTAFYLREQRVVSGAGKLILDAGCGSGVTSLVLAEANPGARIVGVDLSPASVAVARLRLAHHGFSDVEFHAGSLLDVADLGLKFDYINCDEVLYILPDPQAGLQALAGVLRPGGVIRTNLHSYYQRLPMLRAQELFRMMNLMEDTPGDLEVSIVEDILGALCDNVQLKASTWLPNKMSGKTEGILMNYLLQGDKAFTVAQMFEMLTGAGLHFLQMIHPEPWEVTQLFQKPKELPEFLAMALPELSDQEKLQMVELLHPTQRLLDFWCTNQPPTPAPDWFRVDWSQVTVHLHPQLRTDALKADLLKSAEYQQPFHINRYLQEQTMRPYRVNSIMALCLRPLWAGPQPFTDLVAEWLRVRPVDPLTGLAVTDEAATREVKQFLRNLEALLCVLLDVPECPPQL